MDRQVCYGQAFRATDLGSCLGCGKSIIALSIAHEANVRVISVCGPDLISPIVGHSEAALDRLFKEARANAPTIIIVDNIDVLCPMRDRFASCPHFEL
jgi:SpoVK/Ycf46/Vps4 family AAA+-type ATPase